MLALGQAGLQGSWAGIAICQAEAGGYQQFAGVYGGDPVDASEVGEAQPLG
jgi:hypothetical protein